MTLDGNRSTDGQPTGGGSAEGGRAAARRAAQQTSKGGRGRRTAGNDGADGAAAGGRARSRKAPLTKAARRKRALKYTAYGLGITMLVSAGGGYLYIQELNSNIKKGDLNNGGAALAPDSKADAQGRKPLNILMLGSDGRNNAQDCQLGGACDDSAPHADVEMLVHLSADRSNASIMSIPRDTQVSIPACKDKSGKTPIPARHTIITDSLNIGDPGCVVNTWEMLTHIHIDHYMMVDFAGVVSMADAIGGVNVCVKQNVKDDQQQIQNGVLHDIGSHLVLPAGTHAVKGEQALEWLRTRHAFGDGTDIGRAQAQHLYINSMIRQFKSAGTLANPLKLNDLAQAATKALTVDNGLGSVNALANLALELNKVPTNRITTVTMPWTYVHDPRTGSDLVETTADSQKLFQMIVNDVPLDTNAPPSSNSSPSPAAPSQAAPSSSAPAAPSVTVDKSTIHVDVQNSSGVTGRAKAVTDALVQQGFTHASADGTKVANAPTKLLYPANKADSAKTVAAALGLPDSALEQAGESGTSVTLRVGTDWSSGDTFGAAGGSGGGAGAPQAPVPTAMPTTAQSQNAADDANQCMDVNPAPYSSFKDGQTKYIYSWVGSTPPNVPQP
ncbi:LCP family protein [Kitasatospora sp. RB6PN24]|uniref:LCP family protein n=1 Tax=Kitasatospora humi TaxID=2893891 RepID=UPI001E64EB86|nr:LCP family protein [Kitasatospora humi]MCC9307427.1 LCP family protein [Kitasatospora humi]